MKLLDDFMPHILPWVPNCPTPMAEQALLVVARDFCARTMITQQWFTLPSTSGVNEYDIDLPQQQDLDRILYAAYRDLPLRLAPLNDVTRPSALRTDVPDVGVVSGTPLTAFIPLPGQATFQVFPVPNETLADAFTLRVSYVPRRDATALEDILYDDWLDGLTAGVIAYLLKMPGQPFSNPLLANEYARAFTAAVGQAYSDSRRGYVVTSMRVTPRSFI